MNKESEVCQNCKAEFTIEPENFDFYKKIDVPPPTWCPMCRMQRRMALRNERFLYKRKSDFSNKEIFSMHPPEARRKVYENSVWFSDKWDVMDCGRNIDFSRPFFEQLLELYREAPIFALSVIYGVNSDYANNYTGFKNCYLCFHGNYAEDCLYCVGVNYSKNCIDNSKINKCENSYGNFFINSSSDIFFSSSCADSFNLYFCRNCNGCNDCFGCVNLRNKRYYIFNQPHSKEEYKKRIEKLNSGSYAALLKNMSEAKNFWMKFPVRYMEGLKNFNSSGDYIFNSKNVQKSYMVSGGENMKYCANIQFGPAKDSYDYLVWGDKAELVYECLAVGLGVNNVRFCVECWPEVLNAEYSFYCQSSKNIFGCIGLRDKEYCILNKQYTKEEYRELVPKIKKHMDEMPYISQRANSKEQIVYKYGEFFPPAFANIAYNHSLAQEHFPFNREEAEAAGYWWKDNDKKGYTASRSPHDLPDNINDISDNILNEIIQCEEWEKDRNKAILKNCTEAFRIIPRELEFYKRYKLPLPRKCFNCRHFDRLRFQNPLGLWKRRCQCSGATPSASSGQASDEKKEAGEYKNTTPHFHGNEPCPKEFETSYAPDRAEIVYCEACYNSEVV